MNFFHPLHVPLQFYDKKLLLDFQVYFFEGQQN